MWSTYAEQELIERLQRLQGRVVSGHPHFNVLTDTIRELDEFHSFDSDMKRELDPWMDTVVAHQKSQLEGLLGQKDMQVKVREEANKWYFKNR